MSWSKYYSGNLYTELASCVVCGIERRFPSSEMFSSAFTSGSSLSSYLDLASPQTSVGVRLSRIHFSPTEK